ncbi:MAG: chromosome segregation protein SMC [Prochlorococcaceae cyanobacterium]
MVHINQVSLSHFKSFGGTVTIPLEPGFTVVTGPNGSGKSNILDGILFCLGLASSRGMRADRLPDLINSAILREGRAAETTVSVRFDLGDWVPDPAEEGLEAPADEPWIQPGQQEWTVTRRLRVAPGGTYSSTYSADGQPCTAQQLQTQLRRLRVDPEGSNVVMQGDVTRIVSMSPRERRGIIDELAGVALFDGRIAQARSKLDEVQERQERCRIVETELHTARARLERDAQRARLHQTLRGQLQLGRQHEQLLRVEEGHRQRQALADQLQQLDRRRQELEQALLGDAEAVEAAAATLARLQQEVRSLGEEQLLQAQGELAGLDSADRELQRRQDRLQHDSGVLETERGQHRRTRQELQQQRQELQDAVVDPALAQAEADTRTAAAAVDLSRRRLAEVAGRSGAWFEDEQRRRQRLRELEAALEPLRAEAVQAEERRHQEIDRQAELTSELEVETGRLGQAREQRQALEDRWRQAQREAQAARELVRERAEALELQQRTRARLEQEQQQLEREIARLDSRREVLHESRGTGALRLLLEAGLEGIHGPVAQLAEVEERFRVALEVAAGSRLGQVVVDDDGIAARAIALLKSRRAGRLTFLPLNRLRAGAGGGGALDRGAPSTAPGCLGRAVELLRFEPVYTEVFRHVFGDTLVYADLEQARRAMGRQRLVTLEGDLLERSGAMTGGSLQQRGDRLGFGRAAEGDPAEPLRRRLLELGETLLAVRRAEADDARFLEQAQASTASLRQQEAALQAEHDAALRALQPQEQRLATLEQRHRRSHDLLAAEADRLEALAGRLQPLDDERRQLLAAAEHDQGAAAGGQWQLLQQALEQAEQALDEARRRQDALADQGRQRALTLERVLSRLEALETDGQRLNDRTEALEAESRELAERRQQAQQQRAGLEQRLAELQECFGEQRRQRDAAETALAGLRQQQQQRGWELTQLGERRQSLEEEQRRLEQRLDQEERGLPDPRPEVPDEVREAGLEALGRQLDDLQRRMEQLEPVNMLALSELEQLDARLAELAERLEVLDSERQELLVRVETVATLRQEAFLEAFRAVDGHFRSIFAGLSDGEGHLQLDNSDDPLEGGLTLVAHPRGKAVRRLASMSGGEKSLTALSFLFALQRFRPSPFYALDEVDSFLDGVNVERLAALIARQASEAQFVVVSHRRPMIAASRRTIGVTQARGAHTQVVGMPTAA